MNTIRGLLACAVIAVLPAHAQKVCTKAESAAAEKAVDKVVTYANLKQAWKDYGHCDTGTVEEIFTDAVLRLMVEWKNVDTIAYDVQHDPDYKKFIHHHLVIAAKEDRTSVYSRAKGSCPLTQGAFCDELVEVLKSAPK